MTHRKPKVGDRVRFITAIAPAPFRLGTVGTVAGTDQDGEAYGPFEGRSDVITVELTGSTVDGGTWAYEYQFAPRGTRGGPATPAPPMTGLRE